MPGNPWVKPAAYSFFGLMLVAVAYLTADRQLFDRSAEAIAASDVPLLATTGQPQLVEFFHPR